MNHRHQVELFRLINELRARGFKGIYIQIGGSIGAGKSTLINRMSQIASLLTLTIPEINNRLDSALIKDFYKDEVDKGVFQAAMLIKNVSTLLKALVNVDENIRVIVQDRGPKCVQQFITFPSYEKMGKKKNTAALRSILSHCAEIQTCLFEQLRLQQFLQTRIFLHAEEWKCKERRQQRILECKNVSEYECRQSELIALDDVGERINEHLLKTAQNDHPDTRIINVTNMSPDEAIGEILRICLLRVKEEDQHVV